MATKKSGRRPVPRSRFANSEHPLADALRDLGWSQKHLADESGVQQPTINRVLNGKWSRFSPESAGKILAVLPKKCGVTLHDLLGLS